MHIVIYIDDIDTVHRYRYILEREREGGREGGREGERENTKQQNKENLDKKKANENAVITFTYCVRERVETDTNDFETRP